MSEENIDVVRGVFERVAAAGPNSIFDFLAPSIEWKVRTDLPDAEVYTGHEGIRRLFGRFDEVMEDVWFRPEEFIPAGEDEVVVPLRWGGRGKGSGMEFEESRETWIFTVRAGQIVRVNEFASREEALEAAGLSE